jgi:hypothetical protein
VQIYLWRDIRFARNQDTVVSAAPSDAVIAVYGGGIYESDGLSAAFGGSVVFCDPDTRDTYLGVWGARNASRFRSAFRRRGITLQVIPEPPPSALTVWSTRRGSRPRRSAS